MLPAGPTFCCSTTTCRSGSTDPAFGSRSRCASGSPNVPNADVDGGGSKPQAIVTASKTRRTTKCCATTGIPSRRREVGSCRFPTCTFMGRSVGQWLHKAHLPTGQVEVESVLALLLRDLGVRARRRDWKRILQQAGARFED